MTTVLITGVAGFLGRHVARQFAREGWRVIGIDDVPPENAPQEAASYQRWALPDPRLAALLKTEAPTLCVHCAGRASVPLSMEDPAADFRANTVLTFELLDALRLNAPRCRFLFLSSAAVYGDPTTLPVDETHAARPLSPYGYHKYQAELMCEEFSRLYDLPTASVRIFSAYGPGLRRQVLWDICRQVLLKGRLDLHGTGKESRDFIHAADIARALSLLARQAPAQGEVYNLATGRESTIEMIAGCLAEALGTEITPCFDGINPAGNPLRWCAGISRLRELGFEPSISLEQGLKQVATWCAAELAGR